MWPWKDEEKQMRAYGPTQGESSPPSTTVWRISKRMFTALLRGFLEQRNTALTESFTSAVVNARLHWCCLKQRLQHPALDVNWLDIRKHFLLMEKAPVSKIEKYQHGAALYLFILKPWGRGFPSMSASNGNSTQLTFTQRRGLCEPLDASGNYKDHVTY